MYSYYFPSCMVIVFCNQHLYLLFSGVGNFESNAQTRVLILVILTLVTLRIDLRLFSTEFKFQLKTKPERYQIFARLDASD